MAPLNSRQICDFNKTIYAYYGDNGRHDLPWRLTRDPYLILVSEVMLQQTQVPRVIQKYASFMARFPTIQSLATAPLKDVLAEWSGLGYNRRALLLHRAARTVVEKHNGTLPADFETLLTLPGIGKATAADIMAFSHNKAYPFIETNIRTVYIHHFFKNKKDVTDKEILPLVTQTLDQNNPRDWYYALMDYGVMLKSTNPNPSRKSAHHVRQTKFAGSTRQLRGKIIRALTEKPIDEDELLTLFDDDKTRVRETLGVLIAEGLVQQASGKFRISESPHPIEK